MVIVIFLFPAIQISSLFGHIYMLMFEIMEDRLQGQEAKCMLIYGSTRKRELQLALQEEKQFPLSVSKKMHNSLK